MQCGRELVINKGERGKFSQKQVTARSLVLGYPLEDMLSTVAFCLCVSFDRFRKGTIERGCCR